MNFPGAMADLVVDLQSSRPLTAAEITSAPSVDFQIAAIRVERAAVNDPTAPSPPGKAPRKQR
jgi:hypothetical protein